MLNSIIRNSARQPAVRSLNWRIRLNARGCQWSVRISFLKWMECHRLANGFAVMRVKVKINKSFRSSKRVNMGKLYRQIGKSLFNKQMSWKISSVN